MLTDNQRSQVWRNLFEAETRSLYFADLASTYTLRNQRIVGTSFFMSSGAAAAIVGKLPDWVAVGASVIVAVATAYSIAAGVEKKAATMSKLHAAWNKLASDYERLWDHQWDADAEGILDRLKDRGNQLSEQATTEAPNDQALMDKWSALVYSKRATA